MNAKTERKPGESFADYRKRRAQQNASYAERLRPRQVWDSKELGTYRRKEASA